MIALGLARKSSLITFPQEIVSKRSGEFAGFTMLLIEGYRPIHELYGIKSRKTYYSTADYRLLIQRLPMSPERSVRCMPRPV